MATSEEVAGINDKIQDQETRISANIVGRTVFAITSVEIVDQKQMGFKMKPEKKIGWVVA